MSAALESWLVHCDGRPQRPDQWHVTLVFIGGVDAGRVNDVERAGASVRGYATDLRFDRLEHWRKPHVACLTASVTPRPLVALVHNLEQALTTHEIEFDRRDHDYHPHVTLARKVSRCESGGVVDSLTWPIRDFVLVESKTDRSGIRYEPIAHYELGTTGTYEGTQPCR
jgi:2'-5' RNA ligase